MEIIVLAMLAGFIALRLVAVLGKRTGHEGPVGEVFRGGAAEGGASIGPVAVPQRPAITLPADLEAGAADGVRAIAEADKGFDPAGFADGAKAAYAMILEAFWKGDIAPVEAFVADDIGDGFRRAIAARQAEGVTVENRILSIASARVVGATLEGQMAEVTVRFDSKIAEVSRDREGVVVGSADVGIETHDEWTFRRHIRAADPNWLLVATETAEG